MTDVKDRKNEYMEERTPGEVIRKHLISALIRIAFFAGSIAVVFTQVFGIEITESDDMFPAVRAGDVMIYNRITPLSLRDVVVFRTPDGSRAGRVEASSHTTVDASGDGQITLRGRAQPVQKRNGLFYKTYKREDGTDLPVTLDENEYFVLGDKRDTAADSRIYGAIPKKDIKGKVFMILRRRAI